MEYLFLFLTFFLGCFAAYFLGSYLINRSMNKRLKHIKSENIDEVKPLVSRKEEAARAVLLGLVKYSTEKGAWEESKTRIRFLNAGYRDSLLILIYFGGKTLSAILLPLAFLSYHFFRGSLATTDNIGFIALALACFGYYLPNMLLEIKIRQRKREIFENFPDALDLIRVCVSAGLGLDAAIAKVGHELVVTSRALAEEFRLLSLELRAGSSRDKALKNLAIRTGVEDINALVSMLIQAERFGTSVSESLKVHAESLRTKRQMRAQEVAAKIPVKLMLPMIFCILPSLFVVVLGPSILNMMINLPKIFN